MKKIISIILTLTMALSAFSLTAYATDEKLPNGIYYHVEGGYEGSGLPAPTALDEETEAKIIEDFVATQSDATADNVLVFGFGVLSNGMILVNPVRTDTASIQVVTYMLVGDYIYVIPSPVAEVKIYADGEFLSILDAYQSGRISNEILDEIALALNFEVYTGNLNLSLVEKVNTLLGLASVGIESGDLNPYASEELEKVDPILTDLEMRIASNPDYKSYQYALFNLERLYLELNISKNYATETYILSLQETNDDGWYDAKRWSTFETLREELRVALNSDNAENYSSAFRSLIYSFNLMTGDHKVVGDINKDGVTSIADVTEIQKMLVNNDDFNTAQKMLLCMVDGGSYYDGYFNVNIKSATTLQKYLAGYKLDTSNSTDCFLSTNPYGEVYNPFICTYFPDDRWDEISATRELLVAEGKLSD